MDICTCARMIQDDKQVTYSAAKQLLQDASEGLEKPFNPHRVGQEDGPALQGASQEGHGGVLNGARLALSWGPWSLRGCFFHHERAPNTTLNGSVVL